jgi:lipoprotein NlpI
MFRIVFLLVMVTCAFAAEIPLLPPYDDLLIQAREAESKGLMGKAIEALEKAQQMDPKNLKAFFHAGRIHARMRRHEQAEAAFSRVIEIDPKASTAYNYRGWERLVMGQVDKALEDYDRYIELEPQNAPHLWQRGIALYWVGKYDAGRKQFLSHQTVNSQDVENSVFYFMCVARQEGFENARAKIIPIRDDSRIPMMEIFNVFAGKGSVEDVLKAVKRGEPSEVEVENRRFFAEYYLGLYFEAKGEAKEAYEHFKLAATDYAQDHPMGELAKVHFQRLLIKK